MANLNCVLQKDQKGMPITVASSSIKREWKKIGEKEETIQWNYEKIVCKE